MKKSPFIPVSILFIAIFSMGFQCSKELFGFKYNFIEKINLSPQQKSFKLGDTIWLHYANPAKKMFDNLTRQFITVDTVSVKFQLSFNSRYNAPLNPSDGFCDYVTANGVNIGRNLGYYGTGFFFTFGCNSTDNYDFKIGVVPKHKGIYSLDLLGNPRNVSGCPNRIVGFPHSTIEYRFNVTDGNKDIYLAIPPNSRVESQMGYTKSKIEAKQVYIVKVE